MAPALIGLLLVLLIGPVHAAPPASLVWWVSSPEEVALVELALLEVWPQAPVRIQIGTPPPGAPGVSLDPEAGLRFSDGEEERVRSGVTDARTAAALVRSWYTPPEVVLPLPPDPSPPPPVEPEELAWALGFVAGPATRRPDPGPAFHFALQAASPHLLAALELDPAERVRATAGSSSGIVVRRLGGAAGVRLVQPLARGWTLEEAATLGLRLHAWSTLSRPDVLQLSPMPTGALRLRLWSPIEEPGPRLGGGLMASYDGLPPTAARWYDDAQTLPQRPITLAVEFGVLGEGVR